MLILFSFCGPSVLPRFHRQQKRLCVIFSPAADRGHLCERKVNICSLRNNASVTPSCKTKYFKYAITQILAKLGLVYTGFI